MGYTHYFTDAVATEAVIDAATKIVATTTVALAGPMGTGKAVVSEAEGIALNGSEALDQDHESFIIGTQPTGFNFCKTRGDKPYDEVVTAILVLVALDGEGEVSSDGTFAEWFEGIALFEKAVRPLSDTERATLRDLLG